MAIHYSLPESWIRYNPLAISDALTRARAAILSLNTVPFQKRWVEALQSIELKREVEGTSRIEGADFVGTELEAALRRETPEELKTRSQKQAIAALNAYQWIKTLPRDAPVNAETILTIHRLMVTGADEDHCDPGKLRESGANVTFGNPKHRGCDGGVPCQAAFDAFVNALQTEYRGHDELVQAIAAHYHIAAMHPFLDGNGRTARALEAVLLGRANLRDTTFVAMSNYYYEEKPYYLAALAEVQAAHHDLTSFLVFALKGVEFNAKRLLHAIQQEIGRELFRNLMYDLSTRLESPRKRVVAQRQVRIVNALLTADRIAVRDLVQMVLPSYKLQNPMKAVIRDLNGLIDLDAVSLETDKATKTQYLRARIEWAQEITETEFFERVKKLPTARVNYLLK